jgi:hypothetical protein
MGIICDGTSAHDYVFEFLIYSAEMAEIKTRVTTASAAAYLAKLPVEQRGDAKKLDALLRSVTKKKPTLWSNGMLGYDLYHYKSERSTQEGDWPMIAFAVRKNNLTVYLMLGMGSAKKYGTLLKKLGPHKVSGGSCLYLRSLDNIDLDVLKKIMTTAYAGMKKKWG